MWVWPTRTAFARSIHFAIAAASGAITRRYKRSTNRSRVTYGSIQITVPSYARRNPAVPSQVSSRPGGSANVDGTASCCAVSRALSCWRRAVTAYFKPAPTWPSGPNTARLYAVQPPHTKESPHGFHAPRTALCEGCALADDLGRDHQVPQQQAPPDKRQQPQHARARYQVREDVARRDREGHEWPGLREEGVQQRRAGLEPHVLLALPRAEGRRRADRQHQERDRQGVRLVRGLQEEVRCRRRRAVRLGLGVVCVGCCWCVLVRVFVVCCVPDRGW